MRFLYSNWGRGAHNTALVLADGSYEGPPFLSPVKARSVMLLQSGAVQETNGRRYVTVRVDTFVKVEQVGLDVLAKTIQPWIARTADQNFIETLSFVSNFSRHGREESARHAAFGSAAYDRRRADAQRTGAIVLPNGRAVCPARAAGDESTPLGGAAKCLSNTSNDRPALVLASWKACFD